MKIVHISDSHGKHIGLKLPKGEVLIHSGDFCEYGIDAEISAFLDWFREQPFENKILIAGNHDSDLAECQGFESLQFNLDGIHYLNHSDVIIDGVKFFGSPKSPSQFGGAFTYWPGDEDWSKIPSDTDVLITHGPPKSIFDDGLGCDSLASKVKELSLKAHCFGHIHQAKGMSNVNNTTYSNAAESINLIQLNHETKGLQND